MPSIRRAVFLTALPIERTAVLEHLSAIEEKVHENGSIYRVGKFAIDSDPWEVLLAEIGAGNEGAAAAAERAIAFFHPHVALFVGIAGAIKDLSHGDVVAATKIYSYESGKDKEEYFETRPEIALSSFNVLERARHEAGESNWMRRIQPSTPASESPKHLHAIAGPIASGPKVLASTRTGTFNFIRQHYGDAIAVEMEGYGFLRGVAMNSSVQGIVIRGISDCIGDKTPQADSEWQPIAARHAAAFAFQVLAKLGRIGGSIEDAEKGPRKGIFMDVSALSESDPDWPYGTDLVQSYSIDKTADRTTISSSLEYARNFSSGGPIVPLSYQSRTHCCFAWGFPILDFKIVNNLQETLFLNEVVFDIEESQRDAAPLFTIMEDTERKHAGGFVLVNEGVCDLCNIVVSFNIIPGEATSAVAHPSSYAHSVTIQTLIDSAWVGALRAFAKEGVDVAGLVSLYKGEWRPDGGHMPSFDERTERQKQCIGRFQDAVGTLVGEISFAATGNETLRHRVKFQAEVFLENNQRFAMMMPPSCAYEVVLDTDKSMYQSRVQISHEIKANSSDRFTIKIAVPESSIHKMRATVRDVSGFTMDSGPLELKCFVPRSRKKMVEAAIFPDLAASENPELY